MEKAVREWKSKKEESMEKEGGKAVDEPEENIYAVAADSDVSNLFTCLLFLFFCSKLIWIRLIIFLFFLQSSDEEESENKEDRPHQPRFIAHVPVPTQKEVEQALLERRKQELLEKYASEGLLKQSKGTSEMLGL